MCARTYTPIRNALAEAVCCCFHYDIGCQGIEMYSCTKFYLPPLSVTCTYICRDSSLWFSKKYSVYIILTMTMFIMSQNFISLSRFNAAISEIHDFNQNKRKEKNNFENGYFNLATFPRHITDTFFMRVTF